MHRYELMIHSYTREFQSLTTHRRYLLRGPQDWPALSDVDTVSLQEKKSIYRRGPNLCSTTREQQIRSATWVWAVCLTLTATQARAEVRGHTQPRHTFSLSCFGPVPSELNTEQRAPSVWCQYVSDSATEGVRSVGQCDSGVCSHTLEEHLLWDSDHSSITCMCRKWQANHGSRQTPLVSITSTGQSMGRTDPEGQKFMSKVIKRGFKSSLFKRANKVVTQ